MPPTNPWNSLEIAKLLVGGATPVVVVVLGLWFTRIAKRLEERQWSDRTVVERRLRVYDEMAPDLNDLLCYFTYVGRYKSFKPPSIVALKRDLDRKFHLAAPLFSRTRLAIAITISSTSASRLTPDGAKEQGCERSTGGDAKPRVVIGRQTGSGCSQARKKRSDPNHVRSSYQALMENFASELGVGLSPDRIHAGRVPGNIH